MPSLHELQLGFARLMKDGREPPADWFEPACDHWSCYRRSLQATYVATVGDIYPVLKAVVGVAAFDRLAWSYLQDQPSTSGDLHDYGEGLADFVAAYETFAGLPYLTGLASLEWAVHRVFHASDAKPLLAADLGLSDIQIAFHPASTLLYCDWPVQHIWQAHQGGEPACEIDLSDGATTLLLSRPQHEVWATPLSRPATCLAEGLLAGLGLEQACARLLEDDSGCDLGEALFPLLTAGALIDARGRGSS